MLRDSDQLLITFVRGSSDTGITVFNVQLRMCVLCAERWTEENEMNQLKNVYIYPHVGVVSGPTPTQPLKKKKKEEEESWKLGKQKWLHTQIPESI